jgi:hypothetical protein
MGNGFEAAVIFSLSACSRHSEGREFGESAVNQGVKFQCGLMFPRRDAIWICVDISESEPRAMERNRRYSWVDRRAAPSAMLVGMLTAERRICAVNPNRSSAGKSDVKPLAFSTRVMASRQTSSRSWARLNDSPFSIPHSRLFSQSQTTVRRIPPGDRFPPAPPARYRPHRLRSG